MPPRPKKDLRADAIEEYKDLTKRLKELTRNEDAVQVQQLIQENIERCNELYPLVRRKLDGTAADSKNVRELLRVCQETSRRINSRPFETKSIIQGLIRDCHDTREFYNSVFEEYVSSCLRPAPTFEYFYGALRLEGLTVKERKNRVKEKIVETKAIIPKERVTEEVEQDSTPKEVEQIYEQITRSIQGDKQELSFFPTLVDPQSFTKTVENIFHASFLVKESKIGLKQITSDSNKKEIVITTSDGRDCSHENAGVLSFTMKDYRDWIRNYNIR